MKQQATLTPEVINSVIVNGYIFAVDMEVAYRGYYVTTYGTITKIKPADKWGNHMAIIRTEYGLLMERSLGSCTPVAKPDVWVIGTREFGGVA